VGTSVVTITAGRAEGRRAHRPMGRAMHELTEATLLKRARDTAAAGDWPQAYELFVQADAREPLDPADLAVFANCAYAAGHGEATIDAW
jgi:hypothetical protein